MYEASTYSLVFSHQTITESVTVSSLASSLSNDTLYNKTNMMLTRIKQSSREVY
jgi:hypothetical protein